ncbi:YggS family pyridoxal phosphate-dependent enzyme [Shewanella sp. 202IG2-18]|uniref:YggS family pyridoxal phosphate-dependent enzyme n=1 Tax=Parashewanella hymeniacidonis TaxID=2807618 RepID=UPI001961255D|nr:YggS family pyridoxal phosphate-dependent enzyme [Parashewanella hymeniacidonis]MBM7072143.1 YggS family pyridoxal phosphate-dependent enzyme [Parashewanella hymeniacidonis]
MITVTDNLAEIKQKIKTAANKFCRDPQAITLLAVSKTKPCTDIITAYQAGQRQFGENYVKEGVTKINELKSSCPEAIWHYIGPLQSNKTKDVAEHFDWMHTVDRLKIAKRLNKQRLQGANPLQVCIQVNISGENSKSGINVEQLNELALEIDQLPNLTLRGIMAIPSQPGNKKKLKQEYIEIKHVFEALQQRHNAVDTLSIGMSQDLELAIESGSTMVRIGSAIFGSRN